MKFGIGPLSLAADFLGRKNFFWAIFESCGPEFDHLAAVLGFRHTGTVQRHTGIF
jgi:hypothetical protein